MGMYLLYLGRRTQEYRRVLGSGQEELRLFISALIVSIGMHGIMWLECTGGYITICVVQALTVH